MLIRTQYHDVFGRAEERFQVHLPRYFNGLLKQQGTTQYSYYNNGLLRECSTAKTTPAAATNTTTTATSPSKASPATGQSGNWAFQQSVATYDALNRLSFVAQ